MATRSRRDFFALLVGVVFLCAGAPLSTLAADSESVSVAQPFAERTTVEAGLDPAAPNGTPRSFDELLAGFARMPGFEARFIEEKTLALLAVPLRSEGRIYFAPPSSLLRDVTSPAPQRVLVSASQVRLSGAGREEVIDLAARAEVRPLVESLLWLFAGDREALASAFEIDFLLGESASESDAGWRLALTPKEAPLSHLLARLTVRGIDFGAREIEVEEVSGDRSVMRIFEADPNRHFAPAEFESLFRRSQNPGDLATGSDE